MEITQDGKTPERQFVRKTLKVRAGLFRPNDFCYADVVQISEGGLLFTCPRPMDIGQPLELQFFLTSSEFLVLRGTIIYKIENEGPNGRVTYGFRFRALEDSGREAIQEFVKAPGN